MSFINWRQVGVVYRKEFWDILRDRRTMFSMFLFPLVIIPGMIVGGIVVSIRMVTSVEAEAAPVMIIGPSSNAPGLRHSIEEDTRLKLVPASLDYAKQISEKRVRAALEIPLDFDQALANEERRTLKIYNYEGEIKSGFAAAELERIAGDYRERLVQDRLSNRHLSPALIRPFEVVRENVAAAEKVGGNRYGGIIPYILIMICFSGAMYPGIDLAAGEKERGTLEAILCAPVGRMELVLGKFFTVLSIALAAVIAALVGLIGSSVALAFLILPKLAGMSTAAASSVMPTLNPFGLLGVLALMIPLAVLFSAVIFTIALFAKSQKEAQTYLSPLIGLLVIPGFAPMMPGDELNAKFALVPILNISLASKELVSGTFPWMLLALIFVSSCLYALVALAMAVQLFKRESVIFRT